MDDSAPRVTPESLREAVAGRRRSDELVVVLHPDVALDDVAFEADNAGVTVRRNGLVRSPHQVFVFDRQELMKGGMATVTDEGLELRSLPGSEPA
jgi:hypothetical protein